MAGLPWFKVYAAEILSDERFQGWDVDERGAWFTLVCAAWREGSIPSDQASLARLLHVDSNRMRLLWSAIGDRFVPHLDHPGRLTSPRLEMEREDAERLREKKSVAGKKGATSRWAAVKAENGSRMRVPSDKDATPMRLDSAKGRAAKGSTLSTTPAGPGPAEAKWPHVAAVLASLLERGFECFWPADEKTAAKLEQAIKTVGITEAADRVMAGVESARSRKEEPPAYLGWHLDAIAKGAPKPRTHGDLGSEIHPWYTRLKPAEAEQARAELAALHPDLDGAPLGVKGDPAVHPVDAIEDLYARWRAVVEAR